MVRSFSWAERSVKSLTLIKNKNENVPLLEVKDFSLSFRMYKKGLREQRIQVLRRLNMTIHQGEVVAVIGASGSGKSLLADAILGILPENAVSTGKLYYKGELLTKDKQNQLRGKKITLIPQSVNALNPLMKVGKQVRISIKDNNRNTRQKEIFQKFNLKEEVSNYYPFELSGGMARRVLTATALIGNPDLIIADEPTPGLDALSLQEVTGHIRSLANAGKGVMFITHDIDTALKVADRFVIMNMGETIETVCAKKFVGRGEGLKKDYTKALWRALPQNEFSPETKNSHSFVLHQAPTFSTNDHCLHVKDVSSRLENGQILFKDVNFLIQPGEVVGLMGDSGAGKTTLAKIIAGYKKPLTGSIIVEGKNLQKLRGQNPIQLVWQHPEQSINPKWTMKEVLKENHSLDNEIINLLGIREEWLSRWPSELSGGELQRFSIARALGRNTRFLILDEITTMLDAITQAEIWHVILKIVKERQMGVLAISHDQALLKRISHRILDFNQMKYEVKENVLNK